MNQQFWQKRRTTRNRSKSHLRLLQRSERQGNGGKDLTQSSRRLGDELKEIWREVTETASGVLLGRTGHIALTLKFLRRGAQRFRNVLVPSQLLQISCNQARKQMQSDIHWRLRIL